MKSAALIIAERECGLREAHWEYESSPEGLRLYRDSSSFVPIATAEDDLALSRLQEIHLGLREGTFLSADTKSNIV